MKLYNIPRASKILLPIEGPEGSLGDQMCTFNTIDGMYSNISTPDGHTVHLAAYADVIKVDDHYELRKEIIKR